MWWDRRSEIEQLFRHYVYGYTPGATPIETEIRSETILEEGSIALREVRLTFTELPVEAPCLHLAVFHPADKPVAQYPVILGLNKGGNHTLTSDPAVGRNPIAGAHDGERGARSAQWDIEQIVDRGYAFATFRGGDVDPDRDVFSDGVHPYLDKELTVPSGTEWGTLATWAWGAQRCVDYLVDDPMFHSEAIVITGKSRRGKTALLAGATDDRIAVTVPIMSGTGGCALSRNNEQESVARITEHFPHWFNDVFPAFSGRPERLPIDQHLLIAMVAPRPLLQLEGSRDYWANPGRSLDALEAAAPVWELLDAGGSKRGLLTYDAEDLQNEGCGPIMQFRTEVGHTVRPLHWTALLNFLDHQFNRSEK